MQEQEEYWYAVGICEMGYGSVADGGGSGSSGLAQHTAACLAGQVLSHINRRRRSFCRS